MGSGKTALSVRRVMPSWQRYSRCAFHAIMAAKMPLEHGEGRSSALVERGRKQGLSM